MSNQKSLVILFGSQTGTSQDLAERIWKKAKSNNHSALLSSFDKFNLENLNENLYLLCVCSTTGDGVEPDNMQKFWKFIMRKSLPNECMSMLKFAVIGLGDSSYEKFNFTAKKLHKRLVQLGATPLLDVCLCDEQHSQGIEGAYSNWIQLFWKEIGFSKEKIGHFLKYKVLKVEKHENQTLVDHLVDDLHPFKAKVTRNDRVTDLEHFQNVRLIELEIDSICVHYDAGDVLVMQPSNPKHVIDKFNELFEHMKLDYTQAIKIDSNYKDEFELSRETSENLVKTVGDLIERYFDFNSIPKMAFFETFEQLATDELEKEKLMEFLTPEGSEDLNNYCYRPRRTIIEVFCDFPKTTKNILSIDILIELVPSIKPRSFSIASSPFVHKDKIQLLVAVVDYKTRLKETRKGTCSYWLSQLKPKENLTIPIWIKKGSFNIEWSKPLICIGPGTGVAPFRSIINERIFRHDLKENHLYFGCRSKNKDFYFKQEWKTIQEIYPEHFFLNAAFSRDQQEKIYVQDLMLKNSTLIFNLLENLNAFVLIAGNSKRMPQDVIAYLEKIVNENTQNENKSYAKEYVKNLQTKKRIQLETWS